MTETEFNAEFRQVLRNQGLGAIHIREADIVGVFDLLVYSDTLINQINWIELKLEDKDLEISQREFARAEFKRSIPCWVMTLMRDGSMEISKVNKDGRQMGPTMTRAWRAMDWQFFLFG